MPKYDTFVSVSVPTSLGPIAKTAKGQNLSPVRKRADRHLQSHQREFSRGTLSEPLNQKKTMLKKYMQVPTGRVYPFISQPLNYLVLASGRPESVMRLSRDRTCDHKSSAGVAAQRSLLTSVLPADGQWKTLSYLIRVIDLAGRCS